MCLCFRWSFMPADAKTNANGVFPKKGWNEANWEGPGQPRKYSSAFLSNHISCWLIVYRGHWFSKLDVKMLLCCAVFVCRDVCFFPPLTPAAIIGRVPPYRPGPAFLGDPPLHFRTVPRENLDYDRCCINKVPLIVCEAKWHTCNQNDLNQTWQIFFFFGWLLRNCEC